jgi:hypothetical protein
MAEVVEGGPRVGQARARGREGAGRCRRVGGSAGEGLEPGVERRPFPGHGLCPREMRRGRGKSSELDCRDTGSRHKSASGRAASVRGQETGYASRN